MPDTPDTNRICAAAELGEEAMSLLRDGMKPREFLKALIDKQQFPDAVRFLAHALPKREAVWWAWTSVRQSGTPATPPVQASLEATEKWLKQPTAENCRAAKEAAEKAPVETPAGCAGMAAFFSGDSVAPEHVPAVPPPEFAAAKVVAGAVILSAVSKEPEKAPEKFKAFLTQGQDVANRIQLWGAES